MASGKRLIDANELLRDAEDYGPIKGGLADMYDVKWLVDAQFTVDAVEVVRCKDCRYFCFHQCGNPVNGWLPHRMSDDFCSYGERKA